MRGQEGVLRRVGAEDKVSHWEPWTRVGTEDSASHWEDAAVRKSEMTVGAAVAQSSVIVLVMTDLGRGDLHPRRKQKPVRLSKLIQA